MNYKKFIKHQLIFAVIFYGLFYSLDVFAAGLALGVVGGVIGGAIGGPVGAQIGFALGSALGNSLSQKPQKYEGPRLNDLRVQANTYGAIIPKVWGTVQLAGNMIWSTGIKEVATEDSQGGKGGGPKVETTTYSYYANFAIAICVGKIKGIRKFWANDILSYDNSTANTGYVGETKYQMRIYKGTSTQIQDPLIQQDKGDYTPAYRDLAYVVFENFPLEKYGNQIPNFKFEVVVSEEDVDEQLVNWFEYSYAPLADGTAMAEAEIQINPVNKLIYAVRGGSGTLSSSPILYVDVIEPLTNTLIKTKGFSVQVAGGATYGYRKFHFDSNGNIILPACSGYFDLTNNVAVNSIVYNAFICSIDKDSLVLNISPTEVNSNGTDSLYLLQGNWFESNGNYLQIGRRNIAGNYNSYGIWRFNGGQGNYEISSYNIFQTTKENDQNESAKIYAFDNNRGIFYFITYEDRTTKKIAYLNSVDVDGNVIENLVTLFDYTATSDSFDFKDIYFDSVTRSVYVLHRKNASPSSTVVQKVTISNYEATIAQTLNWGSAYASGNLGERLNADLLNRRFINTVIIAGSPDRVIFAYLNMDEFTETYNEISSTVINSINLNQASYTVAYSKEIDAEFWFGQADSTGDMIRIITNYGNRLGYSTYPLKDIVKDVSKSTGLIDSDLDVEDLDGIDVRGYLTTGRYSARAYLEQLALSFNFEGVESNGQIIFYKKGKNSEAIINNSEMGAKFYSKSNDFPNDINTFRKQELELPKKINLMYYDINKSYAQNTQEAKRYLDTTENVMNIELPVVFTADEAKRVVDRIMYNEWVSRDKYEFQTNYDYIALQPSDVVQLQKNGNTYNVRITKKDESQGIIKFTGEAEDQTVYVQNGIGATGEVGTQSILAKAITNLHLLDIPIFSSDDNDYGYYAVVNKGYGGTWGGSRVYVATEQNAKYENLKSIENQATLGFVIDKLNNFSTNNILETGTFITVELQNGTLSTVPFEDILNGRNLALVGNELIQFVEAELISANTYKLSGFMRGRFGTELEINTHQIGEKFILIDFNEGKIKRFERQNLNYNINKFYKAVTYGSYLQDTYAQVFKNTINGLKPYPVSNVKMSISASTYLSANWNYRVRGLGLLKDFVDAQDDGDGSNFEVDVVFKRGAIEIVVGTYETNTPYFNYTNNQFVADINRNNYYGDTISPSICKFIIYKVSKKYGRGVGYDTGYSALNV